MAFEALIGVALAYGAWGLAPGARRGRSAALITTAFAILGFVLGLTFTLRGGGAADVAYHLAMLPVLIATLILLDRSAAPTHPPSNARSTSVLR